MGNLLHRRKAFRGGVIYTDYISLDGVNDYISTPDSATNSVTGEFELILKIAMTDWTDSSYPTIMSKNVTAGDEKAINLEMDASGKINIVLSSDGNNTESELSSAATGFSDGTSNWIRVTYETGGNVKFYTATDTDLPSSWSQLGTTQTSALTSINDSTALWALGAGQGGTAGFVDAKIYYAEVRSSIGGTVVAQFNASDGTDPTYDNVGGETAWTNNGGTSGSD